MAATMSSISSILGTDYNQSDVPTPEAPRPPPPKPPSPKAAPVKVPVVLPSADEVSRVRSSSGSGTKAAGYQPQQWSGVSALSSLELNVKDVSPQNKRPSPAKPAQKVASPKLERTAVPVILPSSQINQQKKEQKPAKMEPRTDWGGVSSQVADDYNHRSDSPQVAAPPKPTPAYPVEEELHDNSSLDDFQLRNKAPPGSRSRGASSDVIMQPRTDYAGVCSSFNEEYNFSVPSQDTPPTRRRSSKDILLEEKKPVEMPQEAHADDAADAYALEYASYVASKNSDSNHRQRQSSKEYSAVPKNVDVTSFLK